MYKITIFIKCQFRYILVVIDYIILQLFFFSGSEVSFRRQALLFYILCNYIVVFVACSLLQRKTSFYLPTQGARTRSQECCWPGRGRKSYFKGQKEVSSKYAYVISTNQAKFLAGYVSLDCIFKDFKFKLHSTSHSFLFFLGHARE